jgi:hypothetical protein
MIDAGREGISTFSHRIHVLPSPTDDGYSGKSSLFSRLLPCSVTDVKDYDLISEIVHGIENQKRISDQWHHSELQFREATRSILSTTLTAAV